MNKRLIFFFSITSIFLLIIISQKPPEIIYGKINSIEQYEGISIIKLTNYSLEIIIFTKQELNLSKNDMVIITGREQTYRNNQQILADKIIKQKR